MAQTIHIKNKVLAAVLTLAALLTGQNLWAWEGLGTSESPFLIQTIDDLDLLASRVNSGSGDEHAASGYNGLCFKLTTDLDYRSVTLVNEENYTAIGIPSPGRPFHGTFDGNNKTISGIRINKNDRDQALFGYIGSGSIVKNVILIDADITGSQYVGGIVGFNASGTIQNCLVFNSTFTASSKVDAVVGDNNGTLSNSYYHNCTVNSSTSSSIIVIHNDDTALAEGKKNTDVITANTGTDKNVILYGRTLYKDGGWNTLCLPFDLTISGSVLNGADVRTLSSTSFNSSTGELTLTFTAEGDVKTMLAGTPYIIKWASGTDIVNPTFANVEVKKDTVNVSKEHADFICAFSSVPLEANDKTKLYLGSGEKLYYPNAAVTINACRAYFHLKGITAGDKELGVRSFLLNFEDDSLPTGLRDLAPTERDEENVWYDLNGLQLIKQPTQRGIYIHNGRKVVIP